MTGIWRRRPGFIPGAVAACILLQTMNAHAQQAEEGGVHISFAVSSLKAGEAPTAGHDAGFSFTLATVNGMVPLKGAKPAAWLMYHDQADALDERRCRGVAARFVRGASLAVPALDLNNYYVLSLGNDASVAVIDPRIGFGGSHLIGLAQFDGPVMDWALGPDQTVLAVAVPSVDQVALADTTTWGITARIAVPHPTRLALTPNGRTLLASFGAADAADSGIAIIDLAAPTTAPIRIATGAGPHDIVIDADGRFAFVTNAKANTVSVVDLAAHRITGVVETQHRPVALAYSALARRAYVATEDGTVTAVGGAPVKALAHVAAKPGIAALRFTPGGRFLLVASPDAGEVAVIDAATDRIVQRIEIDGQPDAVAFSDHVAYIRHRANAFFDAVPLDQIGIEGRAPTAISVGAGQLALGAVGAPGPADAMAPVPEGDGVMIANPGDRAIYFYREGMSASSGSLSTYGREPRAVTVLDRRLREIEPGVYRSVGRLPRAGLYDVVLYVDSPRIVQCFALRIEPDDAAGTAAMATPVVTDLQLSGSARAGAPLALRFRLVDPQTGTPRNDVRDARVLSFLIPGTDASRSTARPLGDGAYQAEVTAPVAGNYYVFVEAPSVALKPAAGRVVAIAPSVVQ
jgi:DNA-binding beta-propeller fold protein YncE